MVVIACINGLADAVSQILTGRRAAARTARAAAIDLGEGEKWEERDDQIEEVHCCGVQ